MSIAYIFPGQGSQNPGMGNDLADRFTAARQVFEEADEALGFALSDLCFKGPAEQLQLTENTQPAILTTSAARPINKGAEARDALVRQVSQPVRWLESVEFLATQGVQTFIEIGPGKVLSGLVRQINRELRCLNVEDESSLRAAREAIA